MRAKQYNNINKIKELVSVAMGDEQADLVITNGDVLNVYTGELLKNWSVSIKGDRIAFLGTEVDHTGIVRFWYILFQGIGKQKQGSLFAVRFNAQLLWSIQVDRQRVVILDLRYYTF